MTNREHWWKNAVIYQIYPKSFQDSNGDGIGDIPGIISRLDYLQELGIDAIWLCPMYRSPQDDNGYDISDYQDIDLMFGTMRDMEELIVKARERGIRIIMDLVLNHTSDEHRWFREAKKGKDNPYHDYYVWRDGVPGKAPNDMRATFGGSAWEWVPGLGQYYFHQFSVRQPDLNWDNPRVREEIYRMIRWWADKGVGGFRLDVIDQIAKEPDLGITANGPKLHDYIREMSAAAFQEGDLITVGEAWGSTPELAKLYSNPDGSEFSMVFQFEHSGLDQQEGKAKWDLAPLSLQRMKAVFEKWQTQLYDCGWNSLFWNNHDLPRIVSRWGNDGVYREYSAKMLATLLHGMQGTPYIYQGEELGMTNVRFAPEQYRDIETLNLYRERKEAGYPEAEIMRSIYAKSRDNARTPMQWDDSAQAGFSGGEPWIDVNPNYRAINVAAQRQDPDSVFHYYQRLIRLHREYPVFAEGNFRLLLADDAQIFAYERESETGKLLVICNFSGEPAECGLTEQKQMKLLIGNYKDTGNARQLRPYEAGMWICGK